MDEYRLMVNHISETNHPPVLQNGQVHLNNFCRCPARYHIQDRIFVIISSGIGAKQIHGFQMIAVELDLPLLEFVEKAFYFQCGYG